MKKTFWSFGLVLAALVVLVVPGATAAEEAGVDLPAAQAAMPAPAEAPFDLETALETPAVTPVVSDSVALDLESKRMACVPNECPCSAGFRCVAKCCVPK